MTKIGKGLDKSSCKYPDDCRSCAQGQGRKKAKAKATAKASLHLYIDP